MRIAGYIEHPELKITLFKMDNKFAVKFEQHLLEQTFKFRTGDQLQTIDHLKEIISTPFIQEVAEQFKVMNQIKTQALEAYMPEEPDDEFDEII